jgi:hypothetical protein
MIAISRLCGSREALSGAGEIREERASGIVLLVGMGYKDMGYDDIR